MQQGQRDAGARQQGRVVRGGAPGGAGEGEEGAQDGRREEGRRNGSGRGSVRHTSCCFGRIDEVAVQRREHSGRVVGEVPPPRAVEAVSGAPGSSSPLPLLATGRQQRAGLLAQGGRGRRTGGSSRSSSRIGGVPRSFFRVAFLPPLGCSEALESVDKAARHPHHHRRQVDDERVHDDGSGSGAGSGAARSCLRVSGLCSLVTRQPLGSSGAPHGRPHGCQRQAHLHSRHGLPGRRQRRRSCCCTGLRGRRVCVVGCCSCCCRRTGHGSRGNRYRSSSTCGLLLLLRIEHMRQRRDDRQVHRAVWRGGGGRQGRRSSSGGGLGIRQRCRGGCGRRSRRSSSRRRSRVSAEVGDMPLHVPRGGGRCNGGSGGRRAAARRPGGAPSDAPPLRPRRRVCGVHEHGLVRAVRPLRSEGARVPELEPLAQLSLALLVV